MGGKGSEYSQVGLKDTDEARINPSTEDTLLGIAGFVPDAYDHVSITYVAAGNDGAGEMETIVYKTGGAAGTTVATLTLTYDSDDNLASVTKT